MAQNNLGGPGLGLPFPQALYPNNLAGIGPNAATNEITLAAGQALAIPPGTFIVTPGRYTLLQYLDPVTSVWLPYRSALIQPVQIKSDGQNYRLANLTGCPIGGYVTAAGSGYAQATTTITSSAGGSLWQPVIGGALNTSISIVAAGAGYTVPPMIFIPAPPSPGIQATAYATITSGTVSAVTVTNQGAGYQTVPTLTVMPSPYDPGYAADTITAASLTAFLTGSGTLTGVLCTNNGAPRIASGTPTLTVSGAGSSATAAVTMCWTSTTASVAAGGGGYTTAVSGVVPGPLVTSNGGFGTAGASYTYTNPAMESAILPPRQAAMTAVVAAGAITSIGSVIDGGLFSGVPQTLVLTNATSITTATTLSLTLGSTSDTSYIQPC